MVSSNYFVFWLRELLSATKTTKNPKTSNKNHKKQKNKKQQRILRNVWAKDFVQRHSPEKKGVSDEGGLDEEGRGLEP